ncbi:MAG TPA: condensation domain-containing protein, partial [Blastocatellia bacterium]
MIEIRGRLDQMVKIRGFRIELGEVEAVLSQHANVRDAVAVVSTDDNGVKRLVAYILPRSEHKLLIDEVSEFARQKLPDYMVPSAYVVLDRLPLTPNGKVDRKALPAPQSLISETRAPHVAPRTASEQALARIWREVLRLERLGIHDNFFELGGDSIISIQIISRANQMGLQLSPKQIFTHQTIAELAEFADSVSASFVVDAEQGIVEGAAEISPVQRWLFEQEIDDISHWNQAVLLKLRERIDAHALRQALHAVFAHHDALRLRFKRADSGWSQWHAGVEECAIAFHVIDLSGVPAEQRLAAMEERAGEFQTRLNLSEGPLQQVALFHSGEGEPDRLLIIIHHLVIEGVSWRILLEDLQLAYRQAANKQPISLPAKTTSWKSWAARLSEYAKSEEIARESEYWRQQCRTSISMLPRDFPEGQNTEASARFVITALSEQETHLLLNRAPEYYRTHINEILLASLARVMRRWTGSDSICVDLVGHGREDLFDDVDTSRTVGWFTTIFPLVLHLSGTPDDKALVDSVKEQLQRIPKHGIGYGLLRYLSGDSRLEKELAALPDELSFDYLGQFDNVLGEGSLFALSIEPTGAMVSPRAARRYLLEINANVTDGQFNVAWKYSENVHLSETIEKLASGHIEELRKLISGCASKAATRHTATRYELTRLAHDELERLFEEEDKVEAVYPLSPLQQGMLFHSLNAPGSGVYLLQWTFELEGGLNVSAFRRAWQRVLDRHEALRTGFIWKNLDEPLQAVHQDVEMPFYEEDWRGIDSQKQRQQLDSFLEEDVRNDFALSKPPLMRLALMRISEDSFYFVWSHHHLLLDGWSLSLVLKEALTFYDAFNKGNDMILKPSPPYRDYIAWLREQDLNRAESYWRKTLAGIEAPTPLVIDHPTGLEGYCDLLLRLEEDSS